MFIMQDKTPTNEEGEYCEIYFDNRNLAHKGLFINDIKFGYHEDYFYDGRTFYKGNFINDEKYGYWENHLGHKMIKRYYAR
jgi:hypothetical protein